MSDMHIYLNNKTQELVKEYASKNEYNFSEAVRTLIDLGLIKSSVDKLLVENNILLERVLSKLIYLRDLLEQFYSDMEIEKLSNPKNNKSLQKFKTSKDKSKYDE